MSSKLLAQESEMSIDIKELKSFIVEKILEGDTDTTIKTLANKVKEKYNDVDIIGLKIKKTEAGFTAKVTANIASNVECINIRCTVCSRE